MKNLIKQAASKIKKSKLTIALTGAGISIESGIPPFRGKGSLWEKYDPMKYAEINYFLKNPKDVWEVFLKDMKNTLIKAKPSSAHSGFYKLEKKGYLNSIITQNIDGLHQKAGNTDVIEFHGSFAKFYCMECFEKINLESLDLSSLPPKCKSCGGILRPDCVFFGESIPLDALERANILASQCEVVIVAGTSAVVQPASSIPVIAKTSGAFVIEINPQSTPLTNTVANITLFGDSGKVIEDILTDIEK
ncbi:MAG: NAD-dependent deacylase [Desulforegulaceae bacterium]|nr:NAD-dependent deacylase [Desulforegulaceae bacterium]